MPLNDHARLKFSAGLASVLVSLTLVILKLWALRESNALSIAASLTDSSLDLMMSFGAIIALLYAAKPADDDHNFGHTSAEDLAALAQACLVGGSGIFICISAIGRLRDKTPPDLTAETGAMIVMIMSIILTFGLISWQGYVSHKTDSKVIAADRLHYIGDLVPAIGAIISLWASRQYGITQIDSLVALLTSVLLLKGAFHIGRDAVNALMDHQASPDIIAAIADMARSWPQVYGFHDLKTRMAGSRIFVILHIELDGDLTLREAHDIGASLRRAIIAKYPQADVVIHKDVKRQGESYPPEI